MRWYKAYTYIFTLIGVWWCYLLLHLLFVERGFHIYQQIQSLEYTQPAWYLSVPIVQIGTSGHAFVYADFSWISLIQYIGANLTDGQYLNFSSQALENITSIAPHFARAYEWWLLLLPIPTKGGATYTESERKLLTLPLNNAIKSMEQFCDMEKIHAIIQHPLNAELWRTNELRNPCQYGMIPYYIAFYGGGLWDDPALAKAYYTIAGMQDDVPDIAQVLAIMASTPDDNPRMRAYIFSLLAYGGYDDVSYQCHELAHTIITFLQSESPYSPEWIKQIIQSEKTLRPMTNPHIRGMQSCYEMLERSIRYVYLDFLTESTIQSPHINTMADVIDAGIIDTPLTIQIQSDMYPIRENGEWMYRMISSQ